MGTTSIIKGNFYIPPWLNERLEAEALRVGRSKSDVIRRILQKHLPPHTRLDIILANEDTS